MKSEMRTLARRFALKTFAIILSILVFPFAAKAQNYTVTGTESFSSGSYSYSEVQVGVSSTTELNINGAAYTVSGTTYLGYDASGVGTLNMTSGTYSSRILSVGESGAGTLTINGGVVSVTQTGGNTANIYIASKEGSYGSVTLNSGTLTCSDNIILGNGSSGGTGVLNINGGDFSTNYLQSSGNSTITVSGGSFSVGAGLQLMSGSCSMEISNHAAASISAVYMGFTDSNVNNSLTITSGTLISTDPTFYVLSGTNTLTVGDEGALQFRDGTGTITMGISGMFGGVNTLNLGTGGTTGGVLGASVVDCSSGTGTVNFNFTGTNSYSQTFSGNLGVNNLGKGKTILTGTNTYTGVTTVNAGELDVNGSLAASGTVQVNSGARLGGSGTVGIVNVAGGVIAPGNSPGTLTVTSLTLDSNSTVEMQISGTAAGSFDQIVASDFVSLSGTLALTGLELLSVGDIIKLIDVVGSSKVTGAFTSIMVSGTSVMVMYTGSSSIFTSGDQQYEVDYNGGDGNDVTLTVEPVPEPGTWMLVAGGLGLLIAIQRRRTRILRFK